jgi:hypothetical protein
MKNAYYYGATFIYFGCVVAGAIIVEDVETIFGFIASISCCSLGFIFPGYFYILANSRYPENRE